MLKGINSALIKRRAEADHAELAGMIQDRPVPLSGGVGLPVKIMQVLTSPKRIRIIDLMNYHHARQRHRVGGMGLQLESMSAGLGSRIHDCQGTNGALVVDVAHLGDHQWWLIRADAFVGDVDSHG